MELLPVQKCQGGKRSLLKLLIERKSEQAHIPHPPTLLENAVYNEWQFQALVTGNQTVQKGLNCSLKRSNN